MTPQEATTTEPTGPLPPGGPAVRGWWLFVAPLLAVLVVTAGAAGLAASTRDGGAGAAHPMGAATPLELASVSEDVAGHYRYAEAHQADLSVIPCFCGCEEFLAHENLYDCFVRTDGAGYDSHAAGCGVCIGEAAVASQLLEIGTPAAEVAERIVDQFGTTPITSPDQTLPRPGRPEDGLSHGTPAQTKPHYQRTTTRRRPVLIAGTVGLALAAGVTALALTGAGSSDRAGGLERTGELNAMGMPVVETPGAGSGATEVAGIVVDDASWELGQVPLNVAVRPTWTLRNTSDRTVTLGEPHPEVREGCCPGPATLGTRTLAPGAATTLTFELSMHPGMDGPHDLGLHIPVDDGTGGGQFLTLDVTGDFRS